MSSASCTRAFRPARPGRPVVVDATCVLMHNPGDSFRPSTPSATTAGASSASTRRRCSSWPATIRRWAPAGVPAPLRPRPVQRLSAPAPAHPPVSGLAAAGPHGCRWLVGVLGDSPAQGSPRPPRPSRARRATPDVGPRSGSANGCNWTTSPARSTSPPTTSAGRSRSRPACRSTAI
jgi:hypothetical protein